MTPKPIPSDSGLPLVLQVAFAGKRCLLDPARATESTTAAFHKAVTRMLSERLSRLPSDFSLPPSYRICGISSLAVGGDTLFSQSCESLGWWQRVFLPQQREDFLAARGSSGPDFSAEQARDARRLLASPHIIEERVASVASDRHTRFKDVNVELVRVCDVLVCLLAAETPEDQEKKKSQPAGTQETLKLAQRWRRPVLEVRVSIGDDGAPSLIETWHWPPAGSRETSQPLAFHPPTAPAPLNRLECPGCTLDEPAAYRQTLKNFCSTEAGKRQRFFRWAALIIVGTHVMATALALAALKIHGEIALLWLLAFELFFLVSGLSYHEWLHLSHAARDWAMARLSAEVARSVISLAVIPRPLQHLFDLPMPPELRPLLRTLNVLHLFGIRSLRTDWQTRRDKYLEDRLRKPKVGQIDYYETTLRKAILWLNFGRAVFYIGSAGAFVATFAKLCLSQHLWHAAPATHDVATTILGFLAVFLPVMAVAALSLAAAFDLEARVHTYRKTLEFLREQDRLLAEAETENEFATLAMKTEAHLLGETATWHARRAYTGVA